MSTETEIFINLIEKIAFFLFGAFNFTEPKNSLWNEGTQSINAIETGEDFLISKICSFFLTKINVHLAAFSYPNAKFTLKVVNHPAISGGLQ